MKCQMIIAGTGGQGVLFSAGIFTEIARRNNVPVLGSQTYGMAQRGGSVVSHLKIGEFVSPLVREGAADLLLGIDGLEAHRCLPYLRPARDGMGALCIVNAPDGRGFPDLRVAEAIKDMGVVIHTCDADAIALQMGNPLVANLVLLGFGSSRDDFPFTFDELCEATEALSDSRHAAANLKALEHGRAL